MSEIIGRGIIAGGGTDTSQDTVTAGAMLSGVTAHDANGDQIAGNIQTVAQAAPNISVSSDGVITASASQSTGYVSGGYKSERLQPNLIGVYAATKSLSFGISRSTPTALSNACKDLAGTSVGIYALFSGGYYGSLYKSKVDAYNKYMTHSTPTALSVGRSSLAGARVGNYALFGGGFRVGYVDTVDAYSTSLTRSTPTALSVGRSSLGTVA